MFRFVFLRASASVSSRFRYMATATTPKPPPPPKVKGDPVNLKFVAADGTERSVVAREGETILEVAKEHNIDEIEGACEGTCCCSTCHIILDKDLFTTLGNPAEEELDMLDLALGLTPTSRLGCQVKVKKSMEGASIQLPAETSNQMS